jgi:hypothetical protein
MEGLGHAVTVGYALMSKEYEALKLGHPKQQWDAWAEEFVEHLGLPYYLVDHFALAYLLGKTAGRATGGAR